MFNSLHAGKVCMLFCHLLIYFFSSKLSFLEIPSRVSFNLDSGLITVQTVCKGYQQATLVCKEFDEETKKYMKNEACKKVDFFVFLFYK